MNLKELTERLTNAVSIGHLRSASDIAKWELSKYAEVYDFGTIGVIGKINKSADKTIMLEAHIDEVGFIVTHVFENGFLKVATVGGNDSRLLPATPVTVHGKSEIPAVFISTPPHLAKKADEAKSIDEIFLDTGLRDAVSDMVSVGDFATYRSSFKSLSGGKVCSKSLDDRAGVACLIEVARRIHNKPLDCNVIFCLSEQEELGTRGARTAAFSVDCDEAIAVDVSFGDAPDISATKCGKLSKGAMIGISPVLDRRISTKLLALAKENNISYQTEVMGGATSTDADVISISRTGIPSGLVSIPLRNMHSQCEVADIGDLESVVNLLEAYILSGGVL